MARRLPTVADGTPIFAFIQVHLDGDGTLSDDGATLPDEEQPDDAGLRWAPGALDGVFGHHAGSDEAVERGGELARLIAAAGDKPSKRRLRKLYEAASTGEALEVVDPVISQLGEAGATVSGVRTVGRWLATTAPDRSAAKLGIALMGAAGLDPGDDLPVVLVLGAHEEFTLFAAVAIANGLETSDRALWALAQRVEGWGRIQCVERLATTDDPEIQDWILRTGFRNSVMDEYLACTAARVGRLHEQLREHPHDRELLTAAGAILVALINGGPAEDLDDWADAAEGVEAYLEAMGRSADALDDFLAIARIAEFLRQDDGWDDRSERGWTASRRDAFEDRCAAILARERWQDLVRTGLLSDDRTEFWQAQEAAGHLGIDTFDALVAVITADPLSGSWFQAWEAADRERAIALTELARTLLPFEQVGSGPADWLGFGPDAGLTNAADWTLQALRDHEGVGGDLLLIGLRSPSIRNRNMALMALATWSRSIWPEGAEEAVRHVVATDPTASVRENAEQLLEGTLG